MCIGSILGDRGGNHPKIIFGVKNLMHTFSKKKLEGKRKGGGETFSAPLSTTPIHMYEYDEVFLVPSSFVAIITV
jgi:hypothetical protein